MKAKNNNNNAARDAGQTVSNNTGKRRVYHMVESSGRVRGTIELLPEQVRQYSICLGCRLMRRLPQPVSYNVSEARVEVVSMDEEVLA